jgi:hypothetical protein
VLNLAVTLSVAEIDPVAAVGGLLNVIGDAIGFGFSGPDPNTIILQGIQNLSQQLYDFESYTQSAFSAISTQLSGISSQISADSFQLLSQLSQVKGTLDVLAGDVSTLQSSVDHLQNEIQNLFASANWNSLRTQIDQYIGYAHLITREPWTSGRRPARSCPTPRTPRSAPPRLPSQASRTRRTREAC